MIHFKESKSNVDAITLKSWESYLELIGSDSYRNWAFRGQIDSSWKLWSAITRDLQNRQVKPEY
jgi:hypothetical protein